MEQQRMKQAVARAALERILPHLSAKVVLGVGTGSTANCFIDALAEHRGRFRGAVASSQATAERLARVGVPVLELPAVATPLPFYVDGADEVDAQRRLIKGGGGALTREKIVAAASRTFVCIVDASKVVPALGAFPLPVEVIPMAAAYVSARLTELGGRPVQREGVTDNGNVILDVHGLSISEPVALEQCINNIAGVVTVGLFAQRPADVVLVATPGGIEVHEDA